METRREVKVFEVNYQCDVCKNGNMQYIIGSFRRDEQDKSWHNHQCDNEVCKHTVEMDRHYPYADTEPKEKRRGRN